ncbi:unnamed protein product [Miscanthus lutarioriparius]|uniref:Amidase domain-containing protein n=1 Tax=Miscanthus lutarioriparius TaxID=422564 RepID=A0A811Q020_9POAL|nr:unnamed protein product [Miscanthus lutarioriparius]
MEDGAKEFNVPAFRENRKLVASENGGLHNPSVLLFKSSWSSDSMTSETRSFKYPRAPSVHRPTNDEDIAFMSVIELGELIRTKQITSCELTDIFLRRLKRYNPVLEAVVTYTEDLAYKQSKEADDLLAQGKYLGPLHGIPYGLKDIIAVPHYKTTWGSRTFKNQVIGSEAYVYKRLKSAGAVLVAKLVTGSLAYDDIWFGGRTRNPWNIEEFSTGSSAGPAASTSAGMVPFAIGSETAGSIIYPAARCGVTALLPTFGTVARTDVMSISESLDKLGPFCRSAVDCAIVLDAIRGKDAGDPSSREVALGDPFHVDITKLTVGYLDDAEMERGLGLNVPARALVTMGWGAGAATGASDEVEAVVDDGALCAGVVDDEDGPGDGDRGEAGGELVPPWSCGVGGALCNREGDGGGGAGGASSVALRSGYHGS